MLALFRYVPKSMMLTAARLAGAGIGFLSQLLLARLLSPADLGAFYSISSASMIAVLVLGHGYPNILARFIPRYNERKQPGYLSAFLRRAHIETAFSAIGGAVLFAVAGMFIPGLNDNVRLAIFFGALTIIPICAYRLQGMLAIAYRMYGAGYLPNFLLFPALFALALGALHVSGSAPSVATLTGLQFVGHLAVAVLTFYLVRGIYRGPAQPVYYTRLTRRWRREAFPLIIVGIFTGLLTDLAVVLVTPFMPMHEVAAFGLCMKISFLVGFAVQVAHQVLLPDMGEAIARHEGQSINAKILSASLAPLAVTVFGIGFSVAFGGWFLGFFDESFRTAQHTLTILMVAQLARAIAGPGPLVITLKGAQKANAAICVASVIVLAGANAILAPLWGAEGAAIALLLTTIFWLTATAVVLYRMDGVRADLPGLMAAWLASRRKSSVS